MSFIADNEGYEPTAYNDPRTDKNGKQVGPNIYRAGYGSDTITKADGSIVKVTQGMSVSKADADRDLARRTEEFATVAKRQVGSDVWTNLPGNVLTAFTDLAYNYGSLPDRVIGAIKSGDKEAMAVAVESLSGDNGGINAKRRAREAALIRGEDTPSTAAPLYTGRPKARPEVTPEDTGAGSVTMSTSGTNVPTNSSLAEAVAAGSVITADMPEAKIAKSTLDILNRHGFNPPEVPVFANEDEMENAFNSGILTAGQVVIVGQDRRTVPIK